MMGMMEKLKKDLREEIDKKVKDGIEKLKSEQNLQFKKGDSETKGLEEELNLTKDKVKKLHNELYSLGHLCRRNEDACEEALKKVNRASELIRDKADADG